MKKLVVVLMAAAIGLVPAAAALAQETPGHPDAARVSALVKQLGDKQRASRMGAVKTLKLTAPEAAIPALVAAVGDKSELRRMYASIALTAYAETSPAEAAAGLDVLIAAMKKPYKKNFWEEKVDVAVALGALGPAAKAAESALRAAVDASGEEFIAFAQNTGGRPFSMPDWNADTDLPPYPFILTRFNKDGDDALKKIRGGEVAQ